MNTLFMHRVTKFTVRPRTIQGAHGPVHFVDIVVEGETPFTITLFSTQPLDLKDVIQHDAH
jgi:hypothetical protein